ncbi:AraC family transcriptional regulator [Variovorax defluvii]|uniref:AraC family transcriptional regulator n=1 Tax=Variovorax defluvii TaxID=913761 RepID=A0ABP8HTR0_9BURK
MPIRDLSHPGAHEALVDTISVDPILSFNIRIGRDFAIRIDSRRRAPLYVFSGRPCRLEIPGLRASVKVEDGDIVFLPHGGAHRVSEGAHGAPSTFEDLLRREIGRRGRHYTLEVDATGEGDARGKAGLDETVVCGSFFWSHELATNPLFAQLPSLLHVRRADAAPTDFMPALTEMLQRLSSMRTGGRGVGMDQAVNTLLRQVVLNHLDAGAAPRAGARAAAPSRDARMSAALHAIHTRPRHPWTLEALAAECHLGRTAFAVRFQAQTGMGAMAYLAQWRVHLAARILRGERLTLDELAHRVGYASGANLARAYKRVMGHAPRAGGAEEGTPEAAA